MPSHSTHVSHWCCSSLLIPKYLLEGLLWKFFLHVLLLFFHHKTQVSIVMSSSSITPCWRMASFTFTLRQACCFIEVQVWWCKLLQSFNLFWCTEKVVVCVTNYSVYLGSDKNGALTYWWRLRTRMVCHYSLHWSHISLVCSLWDDSPHVE